MAKAKKKQPNAVVKKVRNVVRFVKYNRVSKAVRAFVKTIVKG